MRARIEAVLAETEARTETMTWSGRQLAWASYGAAGGSPVFYFSGGDSSRVEGGWLDTEDPMGARRFAIVALSGGGPHALAVVAALPDRVTKGMSPQPVLPVCGPSPPRRAGRAFGELMRHLLPILALAVLGCDAMPASDAPTTDARVPRNCVVFVLDAATARHMSYTGYARQTTPGIDALVKERGFLLTNAHSQTSTTVSSALSYLTGQYLIAPSSRQPWYEMPEHARTFPQAFRDAGFATAGFSENPFIIEKYGFGGKFETFEYFDPMREARRGGLMRREQDSSRKLVARATAWIDEQADERWLVYLHILRPHNPYHAAAPFEGIYSGKRYRYGRNKLSGSLIRGRGRRATKQQRRYLRDAYDENYTSADALVARFVKGLARRDLLDDTLVVIMSDHGEAFLQHGYFDHNTTVYEEMIHVPLAFLPPPASGIAPGRSDALVDLVDLYPTLVDLFELNEDTPLHGRSLVPLMRGKASLDGRTSIAQTTTATQIAFTRGHRKLVLNLGPDQKTPVSSELYDLASDPGERDDLLERGESADELRAIADSHIETFLTKRFDVNHEITPEELEELQALGYFN